MKKVLLLLMLNTIIFSINAQNIDYGSHWSFGCSSLLSDTSMYSGAFVLNFFDSTFSVRNLPQIKYCTYHSTATVTNKNGDLQFLTAGVAILNGANEIVENGDSLPENDNTWDKSYVIPQGFVFLPMPGHPDSSILFYTDAFVYTNPLTMNLKGGTKNLNYSILDHVANNGFGKVVERLIPLIEHDTMSYGQITATKHANGRDWWLLFGRDRFNEYYRFLVTPNQIINYGVQTISGTIYPGLGHACFSPDGAWYARYNNENSTIGVYLDLYQFDRCVGKLSNHHSIKIADGTKPGGVAISPNSRFLYVSSYEQIYQFDLWATDIEASKFLIAEYDGFTTVINPEDPYPIVVPSRFYQMQLANDGKIYISVPNVTCNVLHTIEQPNELRMACDVQQHSFYWPKRNGFGLPNMPNYALGALEGSPCDTLGVVSAPIIEKTKELSIFPNPSTDRVHVRAADGRNTNGWEIRLYDVRGVEVLHSDLRGEVFSVHSLAQGIYFYEIRDTLNIVLQKGKLVKQNE